MTDFSNFPNTCTREHCDSFRWSGVAQNGKERCRRFRSTNSVKAKYWLSKNTATYTGTMHERLDSRLELSGTIRICSWSTGTTGYATGQSETVRNFTAGQQELTGFTAGQTTYTAGQTGTTRHTAGQQKDAPQQQQPLTAGTGTRPIGAEPETKCYSGLLLQLQLLPQFTRGYNRTGAKPEGQDESLELRGTPPLIV